MKNKNNRREFIEKLSALAEKDENIWLLCADVGFGVVDAFFDNHPNRFVNVGVAEQNMIGAAMGLAYSGKIPFCYTISSFAIHRPYEFIRSSCYQKLPVRIIGSGVGNDYGSHGHTHDASDVEKILDSLPNMQRFIPADKETLESTYKDQSVIYYGLSR